MFASYLLNSWIAATLVAIISGLVGFFVIMRRDTFAAHALPLCAFPGAAVASLIGIAPILGTIAFAGLGVLGIQSFKQRQRNEVATALTLTMLLGMGTLFLSLSSQYSQHVYALLFGDILSVSSADLASLAVVVFFVIAVFGLWFRVFLLSAIAPDLAKVAGIPTARIEILSLAILGLATAIALPIVGALLVFSLIVGPASAARVLTNQPEKAVLLSITLAIFTIWSSLALSYHTNWPVGFFVGCFGAISYSLGRGYSSRSARLA
ncbi:MAG: cation ABC transporter permease [Acidocella sp. 20-57-95]|nr:MAG: cation ABC transporter permease [Acidocella sp. 20-57-95]HQT64402.1 metal ABC transporter permease [Acidocella sp.]HQU04871.1 metal ABC transporter permease [Acidocella sp.]